MFKYYFTIILKGKQKPPPTKQERYQTGEEFYLGIVLTTFSLDL